MVVALLKKSDDNIYAELKVSIRDQFSLGQTLTPKALNGAYNFLDNHTNSTNMHSKGKNRPSEDSDEGGNPSTNVNEQDEDLDGMKFLMTDEAVPGAGGRTKEQIAYHSCNQRKRQSTTVSMRKRIQALSS